MSSEVNKSSVISGSKRLEREARTLQALMACYCDGVHHRPLKTEGSIGEFRPQPRELCDECGQLLTHALERLARCHFQADKPTCARCPIHCYGRQQRTQMQSVMRYAGPRLMWRHPILALRHMVDGWRSAVPVPDRRPAKPAAIPETKI
jgi:hypothetical protein